MGRVYEALNKAENAALRTRVEAAENYQDTARGFRESAPRTKDFDFVSYSLGTPLLPEIGREKEDAQSIPQAWTRTTQSRAVEIDYRRVDPRITAFQDSMPAVSSEFNKAAIALISAAATQPIKRVLITSAEHGSGKTSAAINMAFALSRGRKRVLLMDCDFQRPSVLRMLGLDAEIGLAEVVQDPRRAWEATIKISPTEVTLIPMLGRVENPAELLAGEAFSSLLSQLEVHFDFVLVDSAPLLHSAEARLLAPLMDRAILVISPGKITSAQLGNAIGPLSKEQVLGVVLNRAEQPAGVN
jgi:capsular exopolysaccharide synthesis family protein